MNILITGCSRGIGRGFLEHYLAKSEVKKVFAVTTNPNAVEKLATHPKLVLIPVSVSTEDAPKKLQESLSGQSIDLLINCAGTYPEEAKTFADLKVKSFEEGMHVNTYSVLFTLQGCLPALRRAKNPKVASMTSLMGSIADNTSGGSYAYRVSKTALNMLNKCFSIEHPEFTSVVFHPGWVKTDIGGDNAPTTIDESVNGMVKKISELKSGDNGKFFDFEGDSVEW
jgi:NAD(P)-dependent dehydrogenase (short-subunit alcohol dehydrogenase family)